MPLNVLKLPIFAHLRTFLALRDSYFLKPKIKNLKNTLDLNNVLKNNFQKVILHILI